MPATNSGACWPPGEGLEAGLHFATPVLAEPLLPATCRWQGPASRGDQGRQHPPGARRLPGAADVQPEEPAFRAVPPG